MKRIRPKVVFALGLALPVLTGSMALAQPAPGGGAPGGGAAPGGGGAPPGGAPGGTTSVTSTSSTTTSTQVYPGGVAPVPPGGVLGGGNAQYSSSKPITGNERDGFDFGGKGGGGGTVRGSDQSSFIMGGGNASGGGYTGVVPNTHNVHRGDTLWGICGYYFHNPYQWPRIWSYNPQIQNPHWIYPGDQVKLRTGGEVATTAGPQPIGRGNLIDRRRQVPADTIFLRNQGFIEDENSNWGELNGAREDKMFLADFDEVYLRITANHEVKVGQELTVYRPIKDVGKGKLIEIQGTVRVDQWNPNEHIARARVIETLDTIERGARVGPVTRKFEVVPPARNEKEVEATVLTSVHPHAFYGDNQVVFLDKGQEDGLAPGNRLFIIRKGDGFHATQPTKNNAKRIAIEDESPAAIEDITKPRDDGALPEEVVAELRVVNVKPHTAMTMVTLSRREIEVGERAFARKGY
ncbi:MAG: LysM peptidoglycan-binding domain-containing protein [Labilithrix sp.]